MRILLPSLRKLYSAEDVPIFSLEHDQHTLNGQFMQAGWLNTMQVKIEVILTAIKENWGNNFIFADCDIQFFRPFTDVIIEYRELPRPKGRGFE